MSRDSDAGPRPVSATAGARTSARAKGDAMRLRTDAQPAGLDAPLAPAILGQAGQGPAGNGSLVNGLIAAAIIIAGLYYGRELLMPLALAILLGFVLDPLVTKLKRWGLPRAAAVAAVMLVTFAIAAGTASFVASHLKLLAADLPIYQSNVMTKIHGFQESLREPGLLDQWRKMFGRMEIELSRLPSDPAGQAATSDLPEAQPPARVQVVPSPPTPVQQALTWIDSISNPLVTAGIVLLFVCLILLDRGDLRDRLLRLLGGNLHRTTDALNEAGRRVSRYLTMQLVVNVTYGLPMALGLWLIGVPGALLWGLLAAVLRFVPILGPMIAAIFPVTLAFATDPGWSMVLATIGLILTLELISNNVIEPWLYGSSTGMSALSIILSMTFWTAIWGPIGLVLSVPITVTLLVLGRHLPPLQFFDVLLGSEPVLDLPTRLYQRLLAGDFEEASELAVEEADEHSPQVFYDKVAIPTLKLATEAHATVATAEHRHRLVSGMEQVLAELHEDYPVEQGLLPEVICFGGRWQVDVLSAEMIGHALSLAGHPARIAKRGSVSQAYLASLDLEGASVACLTYFSPDPVTHGRYVIRRLRQRWPELKIVLVLWNVPADAVGDDLARRIGANAIASSIEEVQAHVMALTAEAGQPVYVPAGVPDDDPERVRVLLDSGALDEALRPSYDTFAKHAADAFDAALARVVLVDETLHRVLGDSRGNVISGEAASPGASGQSPPAAQSAHSEEVAGAVGADAPSPAPRRNDGWTSLPRVESIDAHVVADGETLIVPDLARDPRFAANPWLKQQRARFYAAAPLKLKGRVIGTLCLYDDHPRTLTPRDVMLLESMAAEVVTAVLRQASARDKGEAAASIAATAAISGDDDPASGIDGTTGVAGGIDEGRQESDEATDDDTDPRKPDR